MARRVALNLGQRVRNNNRTFERGRGRQRLLAENDKTVETPVKIRTESGVRGNAVHGSNKSSKRRAEDTQNDIQERSNKKQQVSSHSDPNFKGSSIESEITKTMGFASFSSTQNQHVKGTDCYGINFKHKTEYRQYINREGGFNRELSPTRSDKKKKIRMSLKK